MTTLRKQLAARLAPAVTLLALLALLVRAAPALAQAAAPAGPPRLVVMIVIDQLGGDELDRFKPALTAGFKRFMDEGTRFTQASHPYAMTETAPGHATLATGTLPSRHGIVANNWSQKDGFDWKTTYAVADTSAKILGFETVPVLEGRSPKNLLRESIADWVREADPEARTASISKKDRAAVTMGGHTDSNVWWLLDKLGIFVTSTYYADAYPQWLTTFNQDVMPRIESVPVWTDEVSEKYRSLARPDQADYELGGDEHSTFPHDGRVEAGPVGSEQFNVWAFNQPRVDDAVLELTKKAITELQLGQRDGHVDFLAVSFSALDRVGHGYGPLSQEALATVVHADLVVGELLRYLDEKVGEGRWVAGLVGDHGVAMNPEAARENGYKNAERVDQNMLASELGVQLREAAKAGPDPDRVADRLADLVDKNDHDVVARAYPQHRLVLGGEPADSFGVLFRNSYYPGRAWGLLSRFGVELRFGEGDLVTEFATGTNHGSPYWYDRHIEMMMLGPGVPAHTNDAPIYSVDFAPTLAGLGGVRVPDDLDGRRIMP